MSPAILTWRLSVRFTHPGRFDKAPESILRNTLAGQMLQSICPYAGPARVEPPCTACVRQLDCVYPRVVKPLAATHGGPTPPPGLIVRYDGPERVTVGDAAAIELTCLGDARAMMPELAAWMAEALRHGVGPRQHRARAAVTHRLALAPPAPPGGDRLAIRFETPLVLRVRRNGKRTVLREIDGQALAQAIRKRIESLEAMFGSLSVDVPTEDSLRLEQIDTRRVQRTAFSARQGKALRAEGLVGEAVLVGDLDSWRAALAAAMRVGIGRMTAWGNGRIALLQAI